MRRAWLLSTVLICLGLTACRTPPRQPTTTPPPATQVVVTTRMLALLGPAELTLNDGCLRAGDHVLVWPPEFSVSVEGNQVTVTDGDAGERAVWHVGDAVWLGGGEISRASIHTEAGQRWLGDCDGANAYWLVGGINVTVPATATIPALSPTTRPAQTSTPPLTPLPPETVAPTVTREPTPKLITPAPSAPANSLTARETLVSPNGQWIAGTSFEQPAGEEEYQVQINVQRVDGTQTWTIVVDYRQSRLGYTQTRLQHWSHDSRYFYFSSWHIPDGGCHDFSPALSAWQRLDVETGTVTDYPLPEGRGHALSPDDSRLAYTSAEAPVQLIWRDLATGDEQALRLPLPEPVLETAQAGDIIWSPSGQALIVAAANHNTLCSDVRPQFSLWRVNLNPPAVMALVEPGEVQIRPLYWTTAERILVGDWNGLTWWMDTESGRPATAPEGATPLPATATPIPPTLTPTPTATARPAACAHAWFMANPPAGCADQPAAFAQTIAQPFERGLLLWRAIPDIYGSQIYAFFQDGQWPAWNPTNDQWRQGQPESDPALVPLAGFYQPVRGFGLFWRNANFNPAGAARDRLGWAIEPELPIGERALQCHVQGDWAAGCFMGGPGDQILLVEGNNAWSTWTGPAP